MWTMTLQVFSAPTNLSVWSPSSEKQISSSARMSDARAGRERSFGFRVKTVRTQELRAAAGASQLILGRWLVSTRPWIIQIRSWGAITTRSLYDFAQHSTTGRHKLWKQCGKDHWLCTPPTQTCALAFVQVTVLPATSHALTPCPPTLTTLSLHVLPRHSVFNSWPSCALNDHSCSFPRTPHDVSHSGRCVQGIQKNSTVREWSTDLLSFYNTQQWDCPQNKWWLVETITFVVCLLFLVLSLIGSNVTFLYPRLSSFFIQLEINIFQLMPQGNAYVTPVAYRKHLPWILTLRGSCSTPSILACVHGDDFKFMLVYCCCVIYYHSKLLWSKVLVYTTYYVISLIRAVSSAVRESGG
jgi:hypothetical protein